jgi:23S rRNA (adenine2503-C2)-methyltransferase
MPHLKEPLFGKTPAQLDITAAALKLPRPAAKQIARWLYQKDAASVADMTDIQPAARERLDAAYTIGITPPAGVRDSADGTRKYVFPAGNGGFVETVYIPEQNRHTLCISSQIGCRMGCVFCATGKQGFRGQLSTGGILNQIRSIPERHLLTNIVYMGMGEPFDNLDAVLDSVEILTSPVGFHLPPRHVTVSTVGITTGIRAYLERCRSPLAVSLHSPFEDERRRLMPAENASPLSEVLDTIRQIPISTHRRIFFEYIVFKGINHSQGHADELARQLSGIRCRINLMRVHPVPGSPLESPDDKTLMAFRNALMEKGFITTIRRSRGHDIHAACGLLSSPPRTPIAD